MGAGVVIPGWSVSVPCDLERVQSDQHIVLVAWEGHVHRVLVRCCGVAGTVITVPSCRVFDFGHSYNRIGRRPCRIPLVI